MSDYPLDEDEKNNYDLAIAPDRDPAEEDKKHEERAQEALDIKHSAKAAMAHECFYCDLVYFPKDALEAGVPLDYIFMYHSKECYETDVAGMAEDQVEPSN